MYEDSGFKEAPYIARRSDGQVVQMPQLLYFVAEAVDGKRNYSEIAEHASQQFGRELDADGAQMLIQEKLVPLGVVQSPDGNAQELQKSDPLLGLKMKTGVVPEKLVNSITTVFKPLFLPPVVLAVLGAFFGLCGWLFFYHGVAQSLRAALYNPLFILLLLGLVILSAMFHECGHASACAYGGARPGKMGVGLYIVWPAVYTDVTDAYRLGKGGRLRTDLGGVYFNAIFTLGTFAAYFITGWEPLLLIVPLQLMEMLHQFLPFIRLDGYYIVGDLTGVPDMFARIKPTLKSLDPRGETPEEVAVLKPWVRVAVTIYVFTVVPLLLFLLGMTVINVPRILATAWDSFNVQKNKVGHESALGATVTVIQMVVLTLPILGLAVTFWKLGKTIVVGAWNRSAGHPLRRGALTLATAGAAAGAVYIWLPNGDYKPIQPGERGTLQGGVAELASAPSGRPSLTPKRAQQLHGAPTKASQAPGAPTKPAQVPSSQPTGTTSTSTSTTTTTTPSSTTSTPSQTTSTPALTTPVAPAQTTSTPTDTTTTPTDTTTTPTDTTVTVTTPVATVATPAP
ncbi:MAG: putative peptide zinc metalloprotease protein [Gaiellaceae bacterium]|nr:putative peptide zinc metalloprotease protein [Gaiellaceae bacterium]